jgi:hypothetical protein
MNELSAAPATSAAPHAGSDRLGGPLWVVFGLAVVAGAWRTERMAEQGVRWFGAPGLVPGLLGIAIAFVGLLLSLRAWRGSKQTAAEVTDWRAFAVSLLLCLGFAGVVLGHGPAFGVAAAGYLFLHIAFLEWPARRAAGQTLRGLVVAAITGIAGGILVPLVFEQIFLVRLP